MSKSKSLADSGFIMEMKDKNGDSWYHQIVLEEKEKEIARLTAESTKWESKFYDEAKKVDKAIDYLDMVKELAVVDKKIILSISTLENILKGSE